MLTSAAAFVDAVLGQPYDLATANCWHLVARCQREVFGRSVPSFRPRQALTRAARAASAVPSVFAGWVPVSAPVHGAVVLLSRAGAAPDIHAGVALGQPGLSGILHADAPHGVVLDEASDLAARGWTTLRFFIPEA